MACEHRFLHLRAAQCLCRGYKTVLRFFPNDVASFEPVVSLLAHLDRQEQQQRAAAAASAALRLEQGESLWEAQASRLGGAALPCMPLPASVHSWPAASAVYCAPFMPDAELVLRCSTQAAQCRGRRRCPSF